MDRLRQVKYVMDKAAMPLLNVSDLRTYFRADGREYHAVDGISFEVNCGEVLGLVGESGCGKSVTSLSVMRLIPTPPGKIVSGSVRFREQELLSLTEKEMQRVRGNEISMIFQEPMTALNPLLTLGDQVGEILRVHRGMSKREAFIEAVGMLEKVRIPDAYQRASEYPHQVSGGMRQRVMIAMALACQPSLLIADEPTTALDVTVQAQILALLDELRTEVGSSILLITHDLGVVAETCDRVVVMYAGQIVENTSVQELFSSPLHPYTNGLLSSIPRLGVGHGRRLTCIEGGVPEPDKHPVGCRFHPRCIYATDECRSFSPELEEAGHGHTVRCLRWRDLEFSTRGKQQ